MICEQCGRPGGEGTFCSNCGAPLAPRQPGAPGDAMTPPRPGGGALAPSFSFDLARLSSDDKIIGAATLVLFISLFLPWFGYAGQSVDGLWHGFEYLTLIVAVAIVAYLVLRAGFQRLPFGAGLPHELLLIAATGFNFILVLIGFLAKPSVTFLFVSASASWDFGAYISLIAAIVAVATAVLPVVRARAR